MSFELSDNSNDDVVAARDIEDISIFQGITEFMAPDGYSYRLSHDDRNIWQLSDGDWNLMGCMPLRSGTKPADIWKAITSMGED